MYTLPENHQVITHTLTESGGTTTLAVSQENAKDRASADQAAGHWGVVLQAMKTLLEKQFLWPTLGSTDREAFVVRYLINGRAPSAKGFQEKGLGPGATTRYLHATIEILAAAKKS